jgi:AraC-like DNA-binding protein
MDIRPTHVAKVPRLKRNVFPLITMGAVVDKQTWIDHRFRTVNFSFILRGGGRYEYQGRSYQVEAPCVLIQWPEEQVCYGPCGDWETWDELYLLYPPEVAFALEQAQLLDRAFPVWPISDMAVIQPLLERLVTLSHESSAPGWIERLDLTCEQLIMETRPLSLPIPEPEQRRIALIRNEMDHSFLEIEQVDVLAAKHGLSRSAFRRQWAEVHAVPPQRYLTEAKLRHACRLLVESTLPIGEIAEQIGFEDRFYFSRKFRQVFGITASEYRQQNLLNPWG